MTGKPPKTLQQMQREAADENPWACRACGCVNWKVRDSRPNGSGPRLRQRACRNCGEPMVTPTEEWVVPEGFKVKIVKEDEEECEAA